MANGHLGSAALAAATMTPIYTVPAGKSATVNINVANRTTAGIKVRVAIGAPSNLGLYFMGQN